MKLIHLSDLHLGRRLEEVSLLEDQAYILQQILRIIQDEQADAVLLCGDIYDKSVPSAEAVTLFDDFLNRLSKLGVPVLAVGVPTIVDSATLVLEALAQAGMSEELPKALTKTLENGRSFFVTRKDSDLAIESLSTMLANALAGVPSL